MNDPEPIIKVCGYCDKRYCNLEPPIKIGNKVIVACFMCVLDVHDILVKRYS